MLIILFNNNWIIFKGWLINGLDGVEVVLIEVWEEVGVIVDWFEVIFLGKYYG